MPQFVIDAAELADKVILTKKEYEQLLKRQSPAGLNKQFEALTTAHAELHRTSSEQREILYKQIETLQEGYDKAMQETVRLRRILKHYDIPEEDIKPAYTADVGILSD